MSETGRWHVDGQPDDEVFDTEGAAIARAWELTPAGGQRPAVRLAAVMRGQELRGIELDEIFDVPKSMIGSTVKTPPKGRIKMVLSDVELALGREVGETIKATGTASMREVIDAFGAGSSSAGEVILWARKTIRELVEDKIAGPVEIVRADLRVEEDPPSSAWSGTVLSPGMVEQQRLIVEAEMRRVELPPF